MPGGSLARRGTPQRRFFSSRPALACWQLLSNLEQHIAGQCDGRADPRGWRRTSMQLLCQVCRGCPQYLKPFGLLSALAHEPGIVLAQLMLLIARAPLIGRCSEANSPSQRECHRSILCILAGAFLFQNHLQCSCYGTNLVF